MVIRTVPPEAHNSGWHPKDFLMVYLGNSLLMFSIVIETKCPMNVIMCNAIIFSWLGVESMTVILPVLSDGAVKSLQNWT